MKRIIGYLFMILGISGLMALAVLHGPALNAVGCFLFIYVGYRMVKRPTKANPE